MLKHTYTPPFYLTIPAAAFGRLCVETMITVMYATGDKELILPEIYDGHFGVWATDRGVGKISVNSNYPVSNNRVRVGGRGDTAVSVLVIGHKNV